MSEIYLDNNATTKMAPEVLDAMLPYFDRVYGNPSSAHGKGFEAEKAVNGSRRILADIFGVREHEVIFTSGGTESINLALRGYARALRRRGKKIITSSVEHKAVLDTCKDLANEGFEVVYAEVDTYGGVHPEAVRDVVDSETVLVAIMHVHNELGTINDINAIARAVKSKKSDVVFFSDGVQAFGKLPMNLDGVDAYAISAHKIHGPKGAGALVIKEDAVLPRPLITGGGQEFNMRSGTQNVPAIVGLGAAAELAYKNHKTHAQHIAEIHDLFIKGLTSYDIRSREILIRSDIVKINSPDNALPTTVNVSFPGIPSEVLMRALEEKGIYTSPGSACTSKGKKGNYVLHEIGLPKERIESALRFSFSRYTTKEEIDYALQALEGSIHNLYKTT